MQTRHVLFRSRARARASTFRSRALASAPTLLVCLGLAACALNEREGDGLATDGLAQTHQFGTATQVGASTRGMGMAEPRTCKNLALFIQHARPRFAADCAECHDGTKLKAVIVFDLIDVESTDPAKLAYTCDFTLTNDVKYDDRLQSTLFTEVDPARVDLEHDFKYPDAASFAAFRDAVMLWLQTE